MSELQNKYKKEIIPNLKKEFGYQNDLSVPVIQKVIINIGLGRAITNPKIFDQISEDIKLISGQKPIKTYAHKSISGFKIRQGLPIGMMVTLRGKRMYDFLEKLINIVLPRVRDFRGIKPHAFDKNGNYSLGIKEHIVFPEIDYEKVSEVYGLEVNIITTTNRDKEAKRFLELLGFPFSKE